MVTLMVRAVRGLLLCTPSAFAVGCAHGSNASIRRDRIAPAIRMTAVSPRVTLEVLDWGGRGPALVFLAGLGNTGHVYDTFAPQFTDRFHVLGITRRGFGASSGSPPPNSLDTLVADITATLDTLGLRQVVLVGHSIAGEEMTRFAELHGTRCAGLIYLDAAYDRSGIDTLVLHQPAQPAPTIRAADLASLTSLRALYARVMGVDEPESDIRAITRFDADGRPQDKVTADSLQARIASGKQVARYDQIHCRALALYAVPDSVADVVPYYAELDAAGRGQADSLLKFVQRVVAESRARIAPFPQNQIVDVHGSNHYLFLQHPRDVAAAMRAFLSSDSVPQRPKRTLKLPKDRY